MESKLSVSFLLGLLFHVSIMYTAYGMMCEVQHPQTAVCRATYVLKAEIIKMDWRESQEGKTNNILNGSIIKKTFNPFQPKVIQARLLRLYKGQRAVNASKGDLIYITYPPFTMSIKEGETYLLTGSSIGKKLHINPCDWFLRWKDMTASQKFGIRRYYYWIYCACHIKTCYGEGCTTNAKRSARKCYISPETSQCNSKKNICMVRNNRCDWDSPRGRTVCDKTESSLIP